MQSLKMVGVFTPTCTSRLLATFDARSLLELEERSILF
ncbi:hypothetical protein GXM_05595 [Nostoc sphaeroides CCNUC1]|uniref:Uncharacterized protein n=1 Tax=Nostoc sphaeroides CCNUC1 TaxID=2653204 RepID=A0A5P8W5T4_9NOSO|nr:hypothetical protein GXM_05595 [Nostoc sphaeroides CCNUC1]